MKTRLTFMLLLLYGQSGIAQYVTDYRRIADVYFHNKEYYAASQYYSKALNISPDSIALVLPYGKSPSTKGRQKEADTRYLAFQLAESLRMYKDFSNAGKWYGATRNFAGPQYESSGFWYGVCLRADQKFDEAIAALNQFIAAYPANEYHQQALQEVASCEFAIRQTNYPGLYYASKLTGAFNSAGSNYAPVMHLNELYFTSSRPVSIDGKKEFYTAGKTDLPKIGTKTSPYINSVYRSSAGASGVDLIPLAKNMEQAATAFTADGKTVYFTAWKIGDDNKRYEIYRSVLTPSGWITPVKLGNQVNSSGSNNMQPFVTADGKSLFFSSDRAGGSGKYDIWRVPLGADGSIGQAINLGPVINTPGDEQAPYIDESGTSMLFSSNGRIGMGGFDFYRSAGNTQSNTWQEPVNMGFPFNSSKDDLYYTRRPGTNGAAYISSDRQSLCCLELFELKELSITLSGVLNDCSSGQAIPGATIIMTDSLSKQELARVVTDKSGVYQFRLKSSSPVVLAASKENYFTKTFSWGSAKQTRSDTLIDPKLCLEAYRVNQPIVLNDVYYEFDKAELTISSKAVLNRLVKIMNDNPGIRIELSAHTDSKGTEQYNLDLSERRAGACVSYLVSQGIDASRVSSKGYGESMPVAPNTLPNGQDNPKGRELNRRTEFKVIRSDYVKN